MAIWAYECRPCGDENTVWYVAKDDIDDLPAATEIIKIKVGKRWLCARLDKSRKHSVEGLLVRTAIGTAAHSCADCADD